MASNSNFSFVKNTAISLELPFSEHIDELKQRFYLLFWGILLLTSFAFLEVKTIVKILEHPILEVKFFQNSPGEYFISTIKIAFYTGFLFISPFGTSQLILYLLPGLTKKETKIILPLIVASIILFISGIIFSYYTLIPTALNFFLNYGEQIIEPFWSFDQYFEFVLVLFYSTGFAFQIPIVQILFGLTNIISGSQMLKSWKYIVLITTIISAILTPSIDPLTQILLSSAILGLYFIGLGILFLLKN